LRCCATAPPRCTVPTRSAASSTFITRKDFTGGTATIGYDKPEHPGGISKNANIGYGYGDLEKDGFNFFAVGDFQKQNSVGGTQRPFNTRYPGGLSPTTSPANYFQAENSANPLAPNCTGAPNLIPSADGLACQMTTSSFVDYVPKSERATGLFKGTFKLPANHELGLEYLISRSRVGSQIAPVPYGGLVMNRLRPNGTPNPYFPGNPGAITPTIPIDPAFVDETGLPDGAQPGYLNVKWRDLPNGPRADDNINRQQRFVASLSGAMAGWDYAAALSYNENKVTENLAGYSDGGLITAGVLNGIINPFGEQSAESLALLESAGLSGTVQTAKGTTKTFDFNASHEFGDWIGAGRNAALAVGGQASRENFLNRANTEFAERVVASTGIDPNLLNAGARTVYAMFAELNVPLMKELDVTAAVRYDKYSDFGSTTNPKFSFRYQPSKTLLVRGSYSTGFRAPSLYEINAAQTFTNTSQHDDPINCPGGSPIPGKGSATNCAQQFQALFGGNQSLDPEESKNLTLGIVAWRAQHYLSVHQRDGGVEHAVREAPLVVVPRRDLHQAARDLGQGRIEIRRGRVVVEVDRDQRLGLVGQDAFQGAFRGALQDRIDFVHRGVALGDEGQVDQRDVDGRHADREAVQLAVQLRQHQADRGGGAGLGRDHAHRGRTGAAQVFVHHVRQHLVVGVGVDGGHQAGFQADGVVQRLDQRGQAVGGAGSVRDDGVGRLQHVLVDAEDDGGVDILAARCRDDDLLGAALQVGRSLFLGGEEAGALQHDVHAQLAPWDFGRVTLREHADRIAVDDHVVAFDRDGARELAVGGVVAGQVGVRLGIAEVVDRHDLDVLLFAAFVESAQDVAADAAITVDCNFDRHCLAPD
jgi:hypothetical protein